MKPGKRKLEEPEECKAIKKEIKLTEEQQEEQDLVNEANELYNSKKIVKEGRTLLRILSKLAEEFNCGAHQVKNIYDRDGEKKSIESFFLDKKESFKSGLIYVCGHPGTGKTSIINKIMQATEYKDNAEYSIFNYNGMAFKNLFEFSKKFIVDLSLRIKTQRKEKMAHDFVQKLERKIDKQYDLIDAACKIQSLLLVSPGYKLVVIDEIDNLSKAESATKFTSFLQSVLAEETETSIIGIANSVDLISKVSDRGNKEKDLVTKKLVFPPYTEAQIYKILSQKVKDCWEKRLDLPESDQEYFESLLDNNSKKFISKKVAIQSGDIRVAFDILKSALLGRIKTATTTLKQESPDVEKLRDEVMIKLPDIVAIIKRKYDPKTMEILSGLPPRTLQLVISLVEVSKSSTDRIALPRLIMKDRQRAREMMMEPLKDPEVRDALSQLDNYGLVRYSTGEKTMPVVELNVEREDLQLALKQQEESMFSTF